MERPDSRSGFARHAIAGVEFDYLDLARTLGAICSHTRTNPLLVLLVNPHTVMVCHRRADLMQAVRAADLVLPDGVGIALAAKILGAPVVERMPGPDLVRALCDSGRSFGLRHYFFGGAPGVPERMVEKLKSDFPGLAVAGWASPPFFRWESDTEEDDCRRINDTAPDIVWVGLGSPKQEAWAFRNRSRIQARAVIPVGAAFDFLSGRIRRAPAWVSRMGIEWLYRLAHEPRRLWRRNLDSPLFVWEVLKQRMGGSFRNGRGA